MLVVARVLSKNPDVLDIALTDAMNPTNDLDQGVDIFGNTVDHEAVAGVIEVKIEGSRLIR